MVWQLWATRTRTSPHLWKVRCHKHRVTKLSPIEASGGDLQALFRDSMTIWS